MKLYKNDNILPKKISYGKDDNILMVNLHPNNYQRCDGKFFAYMFTK